VGLLIQPFLGIVAKILAAKISVFQPNGQIFSLKNYIASSLVACGANANLANFTKASAHNVR
jgi:hypothetical protein